VPLDVLRERLEAEYLPALRYVAVDTAAIADPHVLAITDPDDVPTGQRRAAPQSPARRAGNFGSRLRAGAQDWNGSCSAGVP
jgi:hypothetical protein